MNLKPIHHLGRVDWGVILESLDLLLSVSGTFSGCSYTGITEKQDSKYLRSELGQGFAVLEEITAEILHEIHTKGAVLLKGIGQSYSPEQQARILYILSVMMGQPAAADKVSGQVIWDIRQRTLPVGNQAYYETFSEGRGEAPFHTDTSFYPDPVEIIGLMCIKQAACGGGVNRLAHLNDLKEKLQDAKHRWAYEYLSKVPLAFRIPGAFTFDQSPDIAEVIQSTVLSDKPGIRLRIDSMRKGSDFYRHEYYRETMKSVLHLMALADRDDVRLNLMMDEGDILLVNNHDVIHYRNAFSDSQRHLLRIWIAQHDPIATSPDSVIRYPVEAHFISDQKPMRQAEPLTV